MKKVAILRSLVKFKPHVVHCVEHTPASTFCASLAKSLDVPLVWSTHTNLDFYLPLYIHSLASPLSLRVYQLLRRTFLNLADHNLTVSSAFARHLHASGVGPHQSPPMHVWRTGVDSHAFRPALGSHQMRLRMFNGHYAPHKTLLVSVGRMSPEKNFEFLAALLDRMSNDVFMCVVGDGPYRASLEPLFDARHAHFIGLLEGDELASAYASADLFVYASVS